jgi:hypothetical protein
VTHDPSGDIEEWESVRILGCEVNDADGGISEILVPSDDVLT